MRKKVLMVNRFTFQAAPNYEYRYAVQDGYSYSDFEANEARNGYDTKGGYRVNLPDGRVQVSIRLFLPPKGTSVIARPVC